MYSQLVIWPSTILGQKSCKDFEDFILEKFNTRVKCMGEWDNSIFFYIHDEDLLSFSLKKVHTDIKWVNEEGEVDERSKEYTLFPPSMDFLNLNEK